MHKLIIFILTMLSITLALPCRHVTARESLTFGFPPFANPSVLQQNFSPLVAYLANAVGQPIKITFSPNYITHVMSLGQGQIDIGYMGPSPYVKSKDKFGGIELLAKFQQKENSNNQMVIFTRADGDAKNLVDLAGKTFAFGDYQSFGSHFMPRFLLNSHDVPLKKLAAYDYVGSHDNVLLSVLHGDFSAGGVRLDIYNKYKDRNLRIIYGPVTFPPHVLVCRSSLPKELKSKLQHALLNISNPQIYKSINADMTGFAPVDDRDFFLARKVIDTIESK